MMNTSICNLLDILTCICEHGTQSLLDYAKHEWPTKTQDKKKPGHQPLPRVSWVRKLTPTGQMSLGR